MCRKRPVVRILAPHHSAQQADQRFDCSSCHSSGRLFAITYPPTCHSSSLPNTCLTDHSLDRLAIWQADHPFLRPLLHLTIRSPTPLAFHSLGRFVVLPPCHIIQPPLQQDSGMFDCNIPSHADIDPLIWLAIRPPRRPSLYLGDRPFIRPSDHLPTSSPDRAFTPSSGLNST
ncbi:hypothetical protein EIP91_001343 [Steccherinum ochraceum]|uniref:Uncharacterized protein n=1 Tax=Steccherinum ochraceum TaxID=92696 RepID=A0A4R0RI44_9APHY|nr:hypothetical protein EIP91_001343 [Steccherinum ochraceum]